PGPSRALDRSRDLVRARQTQDQENQEEHRENGRENLRDREGRPGDAREPEKRSDQTDHEERQRQLQHEESPPPFPSSCKRGAAKARRAGPPGTNLAKIQKARGELCLPIPCPICNTTTARSSRTSPARSWSCTTTSTTPDTSRAR